MGHSIPPKPLGREAQHVLLSSGECRGLCQRLRPSEEGNKGEAISGMPKDMLGQVSLRGLRVDTPRRMHLSGL